MIGLPPNHLRSHIPDPTHERPAFGEDSAAKQIEIPASEASALGQALLSRHQIEVRGKVDPVGVSTRSSKHLRPARNRCHWRTASRLDRMAKGGAHGGLSVRLTKGMRSRSTLTKVIRSRRRRSEIEALKEQIYGTLELDWPMTIRQLFYQLVVKAVIEKTEAEYKTVDRLAVAMRLAGELSFSWIADHTRWMRKPTTYSGLEQALSRTRDTYRRALWDHQRAYVEVWLEKDALAGVLFQITSPWDVPLMVTRGFASLSFLHNAAEVIRARKKPTFLYYFGDFDPSGVHITSKVEERIGQFAHDVPITFERVAVTPQQIEEMSLPTRPTKRSDSRSKNFVGQSVEVDAIPPTVLRELAKNCITKHIDPEVHRRLKVVEAQERETLQEMIDNFGVFDPTHSEEDDD
jgi:hypothetical protein